MNIISFLKVSSILSLVAFAGVATPLSANASAGPTIVNCKVNGFDEKVAKLKCDPTSPKVTMATPRSWLEPDLKLKSGMLVKLSLDEKQYATWMAMNKEKK
ncbi:hypothetical protein BH10BDE1_BH10BDE1_22960 [soil metagenome]